MNSVIARPDPKVSLENENLENKTRNGLMRFAEEMDKVNMRLVRKREEDI